MAVLIIGIIAALLIGLGVALALYVECCALRGALAHANKTQHRIALVEGGRYRALKRSAGERAGRRAAYEDKISEYAKPSRDTLESIHALLAAVLAKPEQVESGDNTEELLDGDDDQTKVWTAHEAAHVRVEAEAGGATCRPSATPREALSMAVAPPASAPPSTSPEPAILAAGLGRPRSARAAPHARSVRVRSETLMGMPSPLPAPEEDDASERTSWPGLKRGGGVGLSTRPPPGPAPDVTIPRFAPTLVSMQAQSAPPAMASRAVSSLVFSDLIGRDDFPEEAAPLHLGPEDKTPPRRGRAAVLVPVFRDPGAGEGGAA